MSELEAVEPRSVRNRTINGLKFVGKGKNLSLRYYRGKGLIIQYIKASHHRIAFNRLHAVE